MIEQGDYVTYFYTNKGAKIKDLTEVTTLGLEDAKEMGEETIIIEHTLDHEPKPETFTIDRRIYNSADEGKSKW